MSKGQKEKKFTNRITILKHEKKFATSLKIKFKITQKGSTYH